jgi:hypothetical protein
LRKIFKEMEKSAYRDDTMDWFAAMEAAGFVYVETESSQEPYLRG